MLMPMIEATNDGWRTRRRIRRRRTANESIAIDALVD
jgi:hypothetical protein